MELSGAFLKSKDSDVETSWTKTHCFPNNEGFGVAGCLYVGLFGYICMCIINVCLIGLMMHV